MTNKKTCMNCLYKTKWFFYPTPTPHHIGLCNWRPKFPIPNVFAIDFSVTQNKMIINGSRNINLEERTGNCDAWESE